ncbi:MAG: hypothetical protein K0R17_3489 [Rariglobus sp.]|nr:hypothetical protein [Rariglobus sp.]
MLGGVALAVFAEEAGARIVGGVLIVVAAVYAGFARRVVAASEAEERKRAEYANEPWKWRKEWLGPAIASDDHKGIWMMGVFALFWNAISLPAAWQVFSQPRPEKAAYLVAIFPLVGLGLLTAAVYKIVQRRKFGRARFVPSSLPGVIGGYLGGVIEVPARVVLEADARVALRCIRKTVTGSGKQRRTVETVLWEREERIPADKWQTGAGRTDIPVLFYIPSGQPQTDMDNSSNQVIWRLAAEAAVPGVDFEVTFSVPVFATGETAPPPPEQEPLLEVYRTDRLDDAELRRAGISGRPDGFAFGTSHLWVARGVFTLLSMVLVGMLGIFAMNDVHWIAWVVTGFFAFFMLVAGVDLWNGRFELQVVGDDVVVRQPGGKELRVPRAHVASVRSESGMTIGSKRYHHLVLVGRPGVDPENAHPAETFKARKLRQQLRQSQSGAGDLRAQLTQTPEFEIVFAKHVPGPAMVAEVKGRVESLIHGRR